MVAPYVSDHAAGRTPNPCIECNRPIKFGLLLERAAATGLRRPGHRAPRPRVTRSTGDGGGAALRLRRAPTEPRTSPTCCRCSARDELGRVVLPVGRPDQGRGARPRRRLGLRTADKPDSQDVCFIHSGRGRRGFLAERMPLHPAELVDASSGEVVGSVPAVELVTVGQRRGLGVALDGRRRYALTVDVRARRITVGSSRASRSGPACRCDRRQLGRPGLARGDRAYAQTSAHGAAAPCTWDGDGVVFDEPQPLVAPGQTVALYDADDPDEVGRVRRRGRERSGFAA